jgi:hypothetical protein
VVFVHSWPQTSIPLTDIFQTGITGVHHDVQKYYCILTAVLSITKKKLKPSFTTVTVYDIFLSYLGLRIQETTQLGH